jgi:[acyl-carrier-protein] S-malonyltransferase
MNSQLNKSAFLFPGQGVLAGEICEYYKFVREKDTQKTDKYINNFQAALSDLALKEKFDSLKILSDQNAKAWLKTSFVQPLTYTLSIITYELIKNIAPPASFVTGHSLGAFSALTAAEALSFEDGIRLVAMRGKFMQEESEKGHNGMVAVIGLTEQKVMELCVKYGCLIALINAPSAFVVGGKRDAFPSIAQAAMEMGASKTIPLSTSGAFHTKYMQGAYEEFKKLTKPHFLKKPIIPVVTNINCQASADHRVLEEDIIESFINPVNWSGIMELLKKNSVNSYIEVGPGSSLSSLCRLNGIERENIKHAKSLLE